MDPGVVLNLVLMVFFSFSQEAGVSMFCEPFGDHYNGFRFVSVDFCCHHPQQAKSRKGIVKFDAPFE